MRTRYLSLALLPAMFLSTSAGQQPKSQPKVETIASGVFLGRSGKPMAKARLYLAEVAGDDEVLYARLRFAKIPAIVTDDQGRFEIRNFKPGSYAIAYQPAGAARPLPAEINIKPFLAYTRSIAPLLRMFEVGQSAKFDERMWAHEFTLLKGHTFYSEGENMKIWNASIRRGQGGPCMEVRRGLIRIERLDDKSQLKLDAWSY